MYTNFVKWPWRLSLTLFQNSNLDTNYCDEYQSPIDGVASYGNTARDKLWQISELPMAMGNLYNTHYIVHIENVETVECL